jgi:cytochrome P450
MASKALMELMLEDDPRFAEMFDVGEETANTGVDMTRDYTADMNALREAGAVHKGSLRELLGVPENIPYLGPKREAYTLFSYRACEIGFRENLIFSSEGYNESPGVSTIGPTILAMVGKEHRRYRAVAQPLFKRPKVLNWWNKRWIEETVDALLGRLVGRETADLNPELCSRLPMSTVTRAVGLEGEDALTFRHHLARSSFLAARLPREEVAKSREIVDRTLRQLIAQNLRQPGDNVITGLIKTDLALEDGSKRKLNEEELFGYCKLIIFAGGGTTWRQLGITITTSGKLAWATAA